MISWPPLFNRTQQTLRASSSPGTSAGDEKTFNWELTMDRMRIRSWLLGIAAVAGCSERNTPTAPATGVLASRWGSFGTIQVTAATSGGSREPNGYTVSLVGGASR